MNKTNILWLAGMLVSLSAFGQADIYFNMQVLGTTANGSKGVRVYDVDGVTRIAGTSYLAQLWATYGSDRPESELVPVGRPVFMRSGSIGAGWNQYSGIGPDGLQIQSVVEAFPTSGSNIYRSGGPATVQLRVWENLGLASYDTIVSSGLGKYGKSPVFPVPITGIPPATPPFMTYLQSFALVPEPSTLAFGLLAGVALLWRRRK